MASVNSLLRICFVHVIQPGPAPNYYSNSATDPIIGLYKNLAIFLKIINKILAGNSTSTGTYIKMCLSVRGLKVIERKFQIFVCMFMRQGGSESKLGIGSVAFCALTGLL